MFYLIVQYCILGLLGRLGDRVALAVMAVKGLGNGPVQDPQQA
jgi:hypothetical protein